MRRQIEVSNDSDTISISATSESGVYRVTYRNPDLSPKVFDLTETELQELVKLAEEIIQLANKRDW